MLRLFNLFTSALRATAFKRPFREPFRKKNRLGTRWTGTKAGQRLAPAIKGGNWQGVNYLTYAEHDKCIRHVLSVPEHLRSRKIAYDLMRREIIATR